MSVEDEEIKFNTKNSDKQLQLEMDYGFGDVNKYFMCPLSP